MRWRMVHHLPEGHGYIDRFHRSLKEGEACTAEFHTEAHLSSAADLIKRGPDWLVLRGHRISGREGCIVLMIPRPVSRHMK